MIIFLGLSSNCFTSCANLSFSIVRDGPLLVIASGRDTISVASSIKRFAPENVFVVQVKPFFSV